MTAPLRPDTTGNPFAPELRAPPRRPLADPRFVGVVSGASSTAPDLSGNPFPPPAPEGPAGERPGLVSRVGEAFRDLGRELLHHPVRTITAPVVRGAEALGQAVFSPVEGEPAPVAAKIGYGPTVGLPRPGAIITRENTPVAITPTQQRQASVETLANALAAATFAPARAVLTPTLGRVGAGLVAGAAGGAAAGAASNPNDRGVGAVVGGTIGGVLGAVTPGARVRPRARPNFDDVPYADFELAPPELPPGSPAPPGEALAAALEGGRPRPLLPVRAAALDQRVRLGPPTVPVERRIAPPPPPIPMGGIPERLAPPPARGPIITPPPLTERSGAFTPAVVDAEGRPFAAPREAVAPPGPRPLGPVSLASDALIPATRRSIPAIRGNDDVVTLSDGSKYPVQYQVVEAADLVPSHRADDLQPRADYPAGVQGRRYERNPDAQLQVITRAQQLDPDKLLRDTGSAQGTPIVTPSGVALSGNQRAMMLQRAAAMHPDRMALYRTALAQRAARFGVDPTAIEGMTAPVLVRRLDRIPETDTDAMRRFNAASDVSEEKAQSAFDEGAARAAKLAETPAAVEHLLTTIEPGQTVAGYLATAPGRDFVTELVRGGVIQPHELARFQDARTGTLTPAGKSMIMRALQQTAIGDPDVLARAPARVVQQLDHALPSLVRVAGSPFSLSRDLAEAVDMLTTVQSHKDAGHGISSVADLVGQGDLLGANDRVAKAQILAEFLEGHGRRDVTEAFRRYGQFASEALAREASQGADMFGTAPLTPDEAFLRAFGPDEAAVAGQVAEEAAPPLTAALAERLMRDPKEQFLAKHGRPSVAYLDARKYLGFGERISADELRLEAAARREAGAPSRDQFVEGQEEMFGHALPTRPAPPAADLNQGTLLADGKQAPYASGRTLPGAINARLDEVASGRGLPLGSDRPDGDAGPAGRDARRDTGRRVAGTGRAGLGGGTGEGGGDLAARALADPDGYARAVAGALADALGETVTATRHDPAQGDLFARAEAVARDAARLARSLPASIPTGLARRVPGLRTEAPFDRGALAALLREQRLRPLVGQPITSTRELGIALQVYRDPRVETFRIIYARQGQVVFQETFGSRFSDKQPGAAQANLIGGLTETAKHIRERAAALGADTYYPSHNHPSGIATPSDADRVATRDLRRAIEAAGGPQPAPVFGGHVIINSHEFSVIEADGQISTHALTPEAQRAPVPATGAAPVGLRLFTVEQIGDVATAAKQLQQDPGSVMLVWFDAKARVVGVQETPRAFFTQSQRAANAQLRTWARHLGAHGVFAGVPDAEAAELVKGLSTVYGAIPIGPKSTNPIPQRTRPGKLWPPQLPRQADATPLREEVTRPGAMPPNVAAAYRRRQAKIDFSGALTKEAERANTGLLSSRIQRLGDAIANDKGPIERLGTLAERADPDFRPTHNPKYLLSYAKESAATVHRAVTEGVPDPITRETIGPSYEDLFRPFGRDDAAIRQALTYAVEKRAVARGLDAYGGDKQAFADGQVIVRHGDQQPSLVAFADRLGRFTDALMHYMVRSGVWTGEQAAAMRASDLLYIPYRRILDALANEGSRRGAGRARGLSNVTSGVRSFVGSRRALSNPALALAEYTDAMIRRADAYRVGHALFNAADRLGDYGEALLTPVAAPDVPARAKALADLQAKALASADPQLQELVKQLGDAFTPAVDPRHPVIWRNEPDGSRRYAIVNAPDLYQAVAGLAAPASVVQRFLDLTLLPVRRIFTAATTGFVPRFAGGTNPARDIIDAFAKTQHGVTPVDLARGYLDALGEIVGADKVAKHLPALERALKPLGVHLHELPGLADRAARAKRHGLGGVSMFGAATRPAQIARRYAPTTPAQRVLGAIGRYTGGDRSPLVAVERLFSASDLGPRLGEMAAAERNPLVLDRLRRGVWDATDVELYAATAGRVIIMDFNNQPGNPVVRAFAHYIPFARPALQSPVRYAEAFARNPKRLMAFMAGLSAAAVGAWVLKHRSQQALDATNDRPESERAGFLLFPMDDEARLTLRMPLGQEAAIITSGTTALLDAWMDEDPDAAGTFAEAMLRALPPGVDQWVQGHPEVPIPVLQQIQENDRNRRFFGDSPVEPERLQDVAPEERRYETTPSTYSLLARLTGSSPLKLQNLARGVLSQSEPLVTRGTDVLANALMGESAPVVVRQAPRSNPFNPLSAFVASDPPYRTRSEDQYYALKDRYATAVADAKAALKTRDRSAVARMRGRDELDELADPRKAQVFAAADRTLGQLRDLQHQAEAAARAGADPTLTRERMAQITRLRQQVYREALRQLQGRPKPRVPQDETVVTR